MLNSELGVKDIVDNPKSIFYLLSQEEKDELQHHISLSHYKKNEFIFKEGDKPTGFLLLVDGKVKIFKEGVGGREQIITNGQTSWVLLAIAHFSAMKLITLLL